MTHTLRRGIVGTLAVVAGAGALALAGAGTASAAPPSPGGPVYFQSFSTLNLDPNAPACADVAVANRARGDIILVNCGTVGLGTDTLTLIGIRTDLGSS